MLSKNVSAVVAGAIVISIMWAGVVLDSFFLLAVSLLMTIGLMDFLGEGK